MLREVIAHIVPKNLGLPKKLTWKGATLLDLNQKGLSRKTKGS